MEEERDGQKHPLILVILTPVQIECAKEANGRRRRITHAVICGPHGQMFGTEIQCLKYFMAWDPGISYPVFPNLFDRAIVTSRHEITDFSTTPELVMRLIEAEDALKEPLFPELSNLEHDKTNKDAKGGCCGAIAICVSLLVLTCLGFAIFIFHLPAT